MSILKGLRNILGRAEIFCWSPSCFSNPSGHYLLRFFPLWFSLVGLQAKHSYILHDLQWDFQAFKCMCSEEVLWNGHWQNFKRTDLWKGNGKLKCNVWVFFMCWENWNTKCLDRQIKMRGKKGVVLAEKYFSCAQINFTACHKWKLLTKYFNTPFSKAK